MTKSLLALVLSFLLAASSYGASVVYVLDSVGDLGFFEQGVTTMTGVQTDRSASTPHSLAYNPATDKMYMVGSDIGASAFNALYSINRQTGALARIGPGILAGGTISGLTYFQGKLYALNRDTDRLLTVDPNTGLGTTVGGAGLSTQALQGPMAATNTGLYYAGNTDRGGGLFQINPATGAFTLVGNGGNAAFYEANPKIYSDGQTLFAISGVEDNGSVDRFMINPATGAVTNLGKIFTPANTGPMGGAVYVIPEPGSMSAAAVAALVLTAGRRNRRVRS